MAEDPNVLRGGVFTKQYYTVTQLPPAAAREGAIEWVTDLSTNPLTTAGLTATGGGANRGRVISSGSAWRIYGPNAS